MSAPAPAAGVARVTRRLWQAVEPVHMVVYFHPGPVRALQEMGLRGFWMSYFAGRFGPLGRPGPGAVTALAYGFAPRRVRRAVPDAWALADAGRVTDTWIRAAAGALRQALPPEALQRVEQLGPLLWEVAAHCSWEGRALAAGWADVPRPADPVASAWLAATVLREHRGDGHVLAAVAAGLRGIDASVTHALAGAYPLDSLERSRGWTADELGACVRDLTARGLADGTGSLTARGRALRARLERDTDRLAGGPVEGAGIEAARRIVELALPVGRHLVDSGVVPVPNPVGVPRP